MHGERDKFLVQTPRGARAGQGPVGLRESCGGGLVGEGPHLDAMGIVWPEEPVGEGFGRLFIEQRAARARMRSWNGSHSQSGRRKSKDLGTQQQDEEYKAGPSHVLSRKSAMGLRDTAEACGLARLSAELGPP